MENTNKNQSNKALVLEKLEAVRAAIMQLPAGPQVTQALTQCERLQLSITQFHAEGLRFAAYTLLRMTTGPGASLGAPVQAAAEDLRAALDTAGYSH